jgi:DNA-binding response OmpR family regulator
MHIVKTGTPRILIVDDEIQVRQLFQLLLEREGYQVEGAACGRDAVAILTAFPFDVLVLDLGLPDMDGMNVLHFAHSNSPDLKVIATSGCLPESVLQLAAHLGAAALEKPVNGAHLVETIRGLLAN